MSYLRMATYPSIFERPLTPAQALANIEELLSLPLSRHGVVTLYTPDRDFRKFSFLDVRDPLI